MEDLIVFGLNLRLRNFQQNSKVKQKASENDDPKSNFFLIFYTKRLANLKQM